MKPNICLKKEIDAYKYFILFGESRRFETFEAWWNIAPTSALNLRVHWLTLSRILSRHVINDTAVIYTTTERATQPRECRVRNRSWISNNLQAKTEILVWHRVTHGKLIKCAQVRLNLWKGQSDLHQYFSFSTVHSLREDFIFHIYSGKSEGSRNISY